MKMIIVGFYNSMKKPQRIAGAVYLPVHMFVLPLLLAIYMWNFPGQLTETTGNAIYYGIGFAFCLTAMFRYMRRAFDILLDNFVKVILSVFSCIVLYFLLSWLVSTLLDVVVGDVALSNPNDATISELAKSSGFGPMFGIAVFLAPVVEEVLFRGALFGAIREKSRFWAYAVSIALFGIYHVWQYAFFGFDWMLLVYVIQYVPVGYVLARCYEKTSCIWAPILLHMINNALAMWII